MPQQFCFLFRFNSTSAQRLSDMEFVINFEMPNVPETYVQADCRSGTGSQAKVLAATEQFANILLKSTFPGSFRQ